MSNLGDIWVSAGGYARVCLPELRLMDVVIPEDVHSEQLLQAWEAERWLEILERTEP